MGAQTILIIRHAEKPEPGGGGGVDRAGAADPRSLTPRGWVRAGAWAELLTPSLGQKPALPAPAFLYASAPTSHADMKETGVGSKSQRPLETITPLAEKLGLPINRNYAKGQQAALAAEVSNKEGTVLVCWQHEDIPTIGNALDPKPHGIPAIWPD